MTGVEHAATIGDLREIARRRVPDFVFEPIEEGTGDGRGPRANVEAFSRYALIPRVPERPIHPEFSVEILGRRYAAPFGVSAIGYAGKMWAGADRALAEAAREANLPFMLSSSTVADIETIARVAPGLVWQQLYPARERAITDDFLRRGIDSGIEVLVQTIDMPASPMPNFVVRSGIKPPLPIRPSSWPRVIWQMASHPAWTLAHARAGGMPRLEGWARYAPNGASAREIAALSGSHVVSGLGWEEMARVRARWPGKLVVKGVLNAADADRAFALGADAVTVSNHGGNRLEALISSLDALAQFERPSARQGGSILFDGGVRSGADLAIARALGANFCFVGRAALYGALAGGTRGASKALSILTSQLGRTMTHLGVAKFDDIDAAHVRAVV